VGEKPLMWCFCCGKNDSRKREFVIKKSKKSLDFYLCEWCWIGITENVQRQQAEQEVPSE